MTQEEKQLQLQDLCARVPYHPKGRVVNARTGSTCEEWLTCATFPMFVNIKNNYRLYLRPMSSMTPDEFEEFTDIVEHVSIGELQINIANPEAFDWLNAHHFDFRNLIERKLAIDVTKDGNPYEQS